MSDLTNEQIDALTAGLGLDMMIAEVIGRDPYEAQLNDFRPSSDWNDAMLAASHSHLFELETLPADPKIPGRHSTAQFQAFLTRDCGYWSVHLYCYFAGYVTGIMNRALEHQSVRLLAEDKSGPVAVCKAILKHKRA